MLTRSGRILVLGAIATLAAGRMLGLDEVVILGLVGIGLVVGALAWVRLRAPSLDITRQLVPSMVSVGEPVEVRLHILNTGSRRSPVVDLVDPINRWGDADHGAHALVPLAPIASNTHTRADYGLDTPRRGVVTLGTMSMTLEDPFGLAHHVTTGAGPVQLVVLPHVDAVAPPAIDRTGDLQGANARTRAPATGGEDLATLREYVPGDDLRKVHWATSARRSTLMVRLDDQPWQSRTTVVLDVREHVHDDGSLEAAVSAAASVATAAERRGDELRLITTGGIDSLAGVGPGHLGSILRELAMVVPTPDGSLAGVLATMRGRATGGTLVVITSTDADAPFAGANRNGARSTIAVRCPTGTSSWSTSGAHGAPGEPSRGSRPAAWSGNGQIVLTVDDRGFAACWQDLMGSPGRDPLERDT